MTKPTIAPFVAAALLVSTAAFAQSNPPSSGQGSGSQQPTARQSGSSQGQATQSPQAQNGRSRLTMEVQRRLSDNGYLTQEPNGVWNQETEAALKEFQDQNGLESTGKINMMTLLDLGIPPSIMVARFGGASEMTGEGTSGQEAGAQNTGEQLGGRARGAEIMAYDRGFEQGYQRGLQAARQQEQASGSSGQTARQTQGQGSSQPSLGGTGQRFIIVPSP